uniref:flavin reductase family protein n=1 Tax=Paractinoplanes polyasparticus TaxID=2856853 RepID=UPI001C860F79|nr:flavin reductase family protein [Actinoplanes polyasparticus]
MPPFDTVVFRRVLGRLPTGVVVVTGAGPDGEPAGMTCNSFTSVSLDPPLVLFCVSYTSTTWPLLRTSGRFCVNVLASHHDLLSSRFASGADRFSPGDWVTRPGRFGLADAVSLD